MSGTELTRPTNMAQKCLQNTQRVKILGLKPKKSQLAAEFKRFVWRLTAYLLNEFSDLPEPFHPKPTTDFMSTKNCIQQFWQENSNVIVCPALIYSIPCTWFLNGHIENLIFQ